MFFEENLWLNIDRIGLYRTHKLQTLETSQLYERVRNRIQFRPGWSIGTLRQELKTISMCISKFRPCISVNFLTLTNLVLDSGFVRIRVNRRKRSIDLKRNKNYSVCA